MIITYYWGDNMGGIFCGVSGKNIMASEGLKVELGNEDL